MTIRHVLKSYELLDFLRSNYTFTERGWNEIIRTIATYNSEEIGQAEAFNISTAIYLRTNLKDTPDELVKAYICTIRYDEKILDIPKLLYSLPALGYHYITAFYYLAELTLHKPGRIYSDATAKYLYQLLEDALVERIKDVIKEELP